MKTSSAKLARSNISLAIVAMTAIGCSLRSQPREASSAVTTADTVSHSAFKLGENVLTPDKTTWIFSWTTDDRFLNDFKATLASRIASAVEKNKRGNSMDPRSAKAGAGIYGAADPFSTKDFGGYLLALPIASKRTITALDATLFEKSYSEIISSDAAGLMYPFASYLRDDNGQEFSYAAVIRDPTLVDTAKAVVIGPIKPDYQCSDITFIPRLAGDFISGLRSAPADFFFCIMPLVDNYASFYATKNKESELLSKGDDLTLLFAASIRSGTYIVQLAGINPDSVQCGQSGPYCALAFGRSIVNAVLDKWNGAEIERFSWEQSLPFPEMISAAKSYRLIDQDTVPSSREALNQEIIKTLKIRKPAAQNNIFSQIRFFNDVMQDVAKSSMLLWKKAA